MASQNPSATPSSTTMPPPAISQQATLDQLKASATQQYALKNYRAAADLYSEAAALQDQIYGEMCAENAELLYQYGRCLYHVAVAQSDVLGEKVAGGVEEERQQQQPKRKKRKVEQMQADGGVGEGGSSGGASGGLIGEAMKQGEHMASSEAKAGSAITTAPSKPYFQITGDDNFTDSEGDEDEDDDATADENGNPEAEEGQEAAAEEDDQDDNNDFAIAFEILDVARVLLERKLAALSTQPDTANTKDPDPATTTTDKPAATQDETTKRHLKERLADTHDLQAEISLEGERFHDAIHDSRAALALKCELYPPESSLVAEAHFKLSLALEFAAVTSGSVGGAPDGAVHPDAPHAAVAGYKTVQAAPGVDEALREQAAVEMEQAMKSCLLRVEKEKAALQILNAVAERVGLEKSIAEVEEMVQDMDVRLTELRKPAVESLSGVADVMGGKHGDEILKGVLGSILGEGEEEQQRRLEEVTAEARDLTGLVKQRKKAKVPVPEGSADVQGDSKAKRKAEEEEAQGNGTAANKKARVETAEQDE